MRPGALGAAVAGERWHGIQFGRDARGNITSTVGGISQEIPWPTSIETPDARVSSMHERRVDVHPVSISPRCPGMAWTGRTAAAWKERRRFRPSPEARADTKERVATDCN
jgi:hypothetical protein